MSYAAVSHICLMGPIYHDIRKKNNSNIIIAHNVNKWKYSNIYNITNNDKA